MEGVSSDAQNNTRGSHCCNPLEDLNGLAVLEAQASTKPENAFVNPFTPELPRASDFHKAIQSREPCSRINQNVTSSITRWAGYISARSGKVRCVRCIECFHAELKFKGFSYPKLAEYPQVQICCTRAGQSIETNCAEPRRCDRCKSRRIVLRCSDADAPQFLNF